MRKCNWKSWRIHIPLVPVAWQLRKVFFLLFSRSKFVSVRGRPEKKKKGLGYRVYHSSLIKQIQYSNKSVSALRLSNRQVRQKKRSTKWINNSQFNIYLGVKLNPVLPAGTKLTMAYIMIWDGRVQNYIEWVCRQTSNLLVNFKVALSQVPLNVTSVGIPLLFKWTRRRFPPPEPYIRAKNDWIWQG